MLFLAILAVEHLQHLTVAQIMFGWVKNFKPYAKTKKHLQTSLAVLEAKHKLMCSTKRRTQDGELALNGEDGELALKLGFYSECVLRLVLPVTVSLFSVQLSH